jgi:tetratricopeptide (TPR) repeat protein
MDSFEVYGLGTGQGYWDAEANGRHQEAADRCEAGRIFMLDSGYEFVPADGYVSCMQEAHTLRAQDAIAKKDWDRVVAEAAICLKAIPGHVGLGSLVVPELDAAGRKADADRIFQTVWEAARSNCRLFPHNVDGLNGAAWLAAVSRRRLDEALELAQQAVDLDKDNTPAIDTLAEVHFQRGGRAKAVELCRRCIEINDALLAKASAATQPAPGGWSREGLTKMGDYFRRQLKRFQSGDPNSKPK